MNNSNPFARSRAVFAAIAAAVSAGLNMQGFFADLGEYKSRGHGGKYRGSSSRPNMRSKFPSGKYAPHQGKQEIARRLAKIEGLRVSPDSWRQNVILR